MYWSNLTGFVLAVVSSGFIGCSFIIKKKGLQLATINGTRASVGGYAYLLQPLWWVGMITMIVGEIANFVAYIYPPAVLVTPLGALTSAIAVALFLVLYCAPRFGPTNILVYIGICSVIGSLTVMSVKAIGIAIKLTLEGANQFFYFQTWVFTMIAITCIIVQLNYLNMDYSGQSISSIVSELCGFVTVLSGTTVLHSTREPDPPFSTDLYTPLAPRVSWYIQGNSEPWKAKMGHPLI